MELKKHIFGYNKLSVGDAEGRVLKYMGEPDFKQPLNTKKGELLGKSYKYYVYRHNENMVNEKYDQLITIYFDTTGKITWAVPKNIKGLNEIGYYK